MKKETRKPSFTVSFRLDASLLAMLEKLAEPHNISLHEQARRIVIDALSDAERGAVKEEVSLAREDIKDLRLCLADATEALLIVNDYPKDKARDWTNENIRKR